MRIRWRKSRSGRRRRGKREFAYFVFSLLLIIDIEFLSFPPLPRNRSAPNFVVRAELATRGKSEKEMLRPFR